MIQACREKGVDCIVAPYEADAQLAYLNKIGVAQVIITEDSDLVLFGCDRVRIFYYINVTVCGTFVLHNKLQCLFGFPLCRTDY
jgi:exonuclease 1